MSKGHENKKSNMISIESLNKVSKSICKLICKNSNQEWTGTGFFMSIKFENEALINCLITNYHIIDQHISSTLIQLQIGDNKKDFNIGKERYIKCFKKPIDITMIEILKEDEFIKDVEFLSYDLNYIKCGYDYYLNKEIFILQHPYGEEMHSAIGKINNIKNFEFKHDAGTCPGSSGSAVILVENNCVIGIHKGTKKSSEKKIGTFIGKLFEGIVIDSKLQKRICNLKKQINFETNKIENEQPQIIINNSQSLSQKNYNENSFDKNNQENSYKNVLTLKYIVKKNTKEVILFSNYFVKNNRNKFVMYINKEKNGICHKMKISRVRIINNILEVKLKKVNEVANFVQMFEGTDLIFISGFSSFDTKEVTDISSMFSGCEKLSSIIDIDFLDTSNVEYMNHMFYNCKSIETLPDISKWNTSNVKDISFMFSGCKKVKSLPDISKWNISFAKDISYMFEGCKNLKTLPDISKWNTSNVTKLKGLFSNCSSLISLPDISKWDISRAKDINYLFSYCESLISVPDILKWNTKNIKNLDSLFYQCKSLKSIPDISKWKTNKINYKDNLINGCENSNEFPEIAKCRI